MASTEKLPSGRYRGVYYLAERPGEKPRKRRVKGTFKHKKVALDAAIEAEGRSIGDPQHDPARGRMPWGEWCDRWWPTRVLAESTEQKQRSYRDRHLRPRWGAVELVDIAHHDVQAWVGELTRSGLGASTVRQAERILSASMMDAVRAGLVRASPCVGVRLPPLPTASERYLTDGEVAALFHHFDGRWRVLVEVMLDAGLRIGEAAGLHWSRVNFDSGLIDVLEQWSPAARRVKATKGHDRRTVPLTPHLREVLEAWAPHSAYGTSCGLEHAPGAPCLSGLVVPSAEGRAVDATNFYHRHWCKALRLAGVGHARPHDLRHTWASRLVTAPGVDLVRVQRWAGHASISTTQRYAHLMDEDAELYRTALAGRSAPTLRSVK